MESVLGNATTCESGGDETSAKGYGEGHGKKILFVPGKEGKDGTLAQSHWDAIGSR